MKKLILITLLLIPLLLSAQPSQSLNNNTSTLLGSSATWNGTIEAVAGDYQWLQVVVRSNKSSATDGLVVRWTDKSSGTIVWTNAIKKSYTANDTTTNVYWFPITGSYFKVSYTNTNSAQTGTFRLTTYLIKNTNDATITVTGGAINLASYSIPSYGNVTIGVTADTLSGTSVACAEIWIMNLSPGKTLYFGFNASITTSNAYGALGYLDDVKLRLPNLNKVYLISDTASTDVRYTYFNY